MLNRLKMLNDLVHSTAPPLFKRLMRAYAPIAGSVMKSQSTLPLCLCKLCGKHTPFFSIGSTHYKTNFYADLH